MPKSCKWSRKRLVPRKRLFSTICTLHVARCGLSTDRRRLRNRAQTQDIALLKRQTKARLAQVERQIAELDAEIAALIEAHEATARSRDILCSMPGIGSFTAAAMDSAAGNRHAGTQTGG